MLFTFFYANINNNGDGGGDDDISHMQVSTYFEGRCSHDDMLKCFSVQVFHMFLASVLFLFISSLILLISFSISSCLKTELKAYGMTSTMMRRPTNKITRVGRISFTS